MAEETVVIYNIRLDRLETVRRHIGLLLTRNNPTTWRMATPSDEGKTTANISPPEVPQDGADVATAEVKAEVTEEKPKRKRRKRRTKAQIEADKLKENEQSNS